MKGNTKKIFFYRKDFYISVFCSLTDRPTKKNIYRIDDHMQDESTQEKSGPIS